MRHLILPCAALLLLTATACHSENPMTPSLAAAEQDVENGGRGLAKLNPSPTRGVELVVTVADAPGTFQTIKGVAQYDVTNEAQCGHINEATGTPARITSMEPFELTRVSDTEFRGTFFLDRMLDEDYYGRGVCHWEFSGANAALQATGAAEETRFISRIDKQGVAAGAAVTYHFVDKAYPRTDTDGYAYHGDTDTGALSPELRDATFTVTLKTEGTAR